MPHIVIVDDEEGLRNGIGKILKSMGNVHLACNADLGFNLISDLMKEKIKKIILLSDCDLKAETNGLQLIQAVRKHYGFNCSCLFTILMTGSRKIIKDIENNWQLKKNINLVLLKPFECQELKNVIRSFLCN
ncbi:response regulator [Patescibacteria group bacterium]